MKTYLIELDYIGMANLLEYVNLARHPFYISFVFNAIFLEYLYGNLFPSDSMGADSNLAEGARAERSTYIR